MRQELMRAIVVHESGTKGDWNALAFEEVPRPSLKPGELMVQVEACSVNRADLLQRRGLYPPPTGASSIMGLDFAGSIVETTADVENWHVGDRVFGIIAGGGYGRYLTIPAIHAIAIPENLSFIEAAAAAEVFFTAFYNLFLQAGTNAGETLLIHGGGSGVGTAAIQLARAFNISVIVTAGSQDKISRCLELGASSGINYKEEDFVARTNVITDGKGVDVVLDWIGAPYLNRNLEILKPRGRLVVIGLMGGNKAEIHLAPLLAKRLHIIGSVLRSQSTEEKATLARAFADQVWPLLKSGKARPVIDRIYPIQEAEEAHQYMRENRHFGKIVLTWQ